MYNQILEELYNKHWNMSNILFDNLNRKLDYNMNIDLDGMLHTPINNELNVELDIVLITEIESFN